MLQSDKKVFLWNKFIKKISYKIILYTNPNNLTKNKLILTKPKKEIYHE